MRMTCYHTMVLIKSINTFYSKLYMNLDNDFHLVDFDYENDFFSLLKNQGEVVKII